MKDMVKAELALYIKTLWDLLDVVRYCYGDDDNAECKKAEEALVGERNRAMKLLVKHINEGQKI